MFCRPGIQSRVQQEQAGNPTLHADRADGICGECQGARGPRASTHTKLIHRSTAAQAPCIQHSSAAAACEVHRSGVAPTCAACV